jgi:rubredoxin
MEQNFDCPLCQNIFSDIETLELHIHYEHNEIDMLQNDVENNQDESDIDDENSDINDENSDIDDENSDINDENSDINDEENDYNENIITTMINIITGTGNTNDNNILSEILNNEPLGNWADLSDDENSSMPDLTDGSNQEDENNEEYNDSEEEEYNDSEEEEEEYNDEEENDNEEEEENDNYDSDYTDDENDAYYQDNGKKYKCPMCTLVFNTEFALNNHVNIKHNDYNDLCILADDCKGNYGFPGFGILSDTDGINMLEYYEPNIICGETCVCPICVIDIDSYESLYNKTCNQINDILVDEKNKSYGLKLKCCNNIICNQCIINNYNMSGNLICPFCTKNHEFKNGDYIISYEIDLHAWILWNLKQYFNGKI